jgi:hypothetical protein
MPACNLGAGDDGNNASGNGCNVADLCAVGWHVCDSAMDVMDSHQGGCTGVTVNNDPNLFFATRQSGPGFGDCGNGANDLFGCGNWGAGIFGNGCAPLDLFSNDLCVDLGGPWQCGNDGEQEANNVTKTDATVGGVLCCRD